MGMPAHFIASRREVPSSVVTLYCFVAPETLVKSTLKDTAERYGSHGLLTGKGAGGDRLDGVADKGLHGKMILSLFSTVLFLYESNWYEP